MSVYQRMKNYNNVPRQIRKTTKKPLLICGQKNVETYSRSNAVALDLEEEVLLKHPSKNKTRKKKRTQQEKTDWRRMTKYLPPKA